VKEFMTRGLFTVFPEATIEEVIRTMTSFKIHRVFVIDEKEGTLEGVITTMDVLRWLEGRKSRRRNNKRTQRV
jgi:CBS domain-containing protein